ncbi:LysM peptidoglycan-binding domain-containing protein [Saezia sanguinis]|uniref:LysM peptidoglycan-binding domain-containing protein n=1 Tax=Saezia sanguinis TaxID=1965230 RepID=UPI003054BE59
MKSDQLSKKLRLLVLAAAMTTSVASFGQAAAGSDQWHITASQSAAATLAAQNGVHVSELREDAPATYQIKQGDTLWSISGFFLKDPWKWPALWGMNQSQIRNPNRIYPGQMLYLNRQGDRATLQIATAVGSSGNTRANSAASGAIPTVRLSPGVRSEALDDNAVPVLPPEAVIPFLEHGVIVSRDEFENSPRVVATQERRLILTAGDKVYTRGGTINPAEQKIYLAYTTPEAVRDPETKDVLGFQATYLGKLQYVRAGSEGRAGSYDPTEVPATFVITETKQEIRVGDRLTPASNQQELLTDYVPSAAPAGMEGRVVSLYGGNAFRHGSLYQIVLLGRGHLDGLERGNVVALWRTGVEVRDRTMPEQQRFVTPWSENDRLSQRQSNMMTLPDERYGLAMVFKTYDHLSYAIIMQVTDSVEPGDKFTTP